MARRWTRCTDAIVAVTAIATVIVGIAEPGQAPAQPGQVVTVCGSDDAPGGLNLATALSRGGPITIRCPDGQNEIRFTRTRNVAVDTAIIGGGDRHVSLRGPTGSPMFTTSRALTLSKLTLTNPSAVTGSIVAGNQADITLTSVVVTGSPAAILARSLHAEDSRFTDNGDKAAEASGAAVINAETVTLRNSEFTDNADHPIAGGAWPSPGRAPLSRQVAMERTRFSGNRNTILLIDAKVSIQASVFTNNGRKPDIARDAWGCCGGAITLVRSDAEIGDSDFVGNGSAGFGGAIHSIGSRLTVRSSTFDNNQARVGGAIMSWARNPKNNIWSTDEWTDAPRLAMTRVTFIDNTATAHGGAITFTGSLRGEGLAFESNSAESAGGAIASWQAAPLPEPYGDVLDALAANSESEPTDTMTLTRSVIVENHAGVSGAALAVAETDTALGNSIIARNDTGGAAIVGSKLRLVNAVVADNTGTGLQAPTGGTITLGNTAVMNNSVNCAPGIHPAVAGRNMQYPGADCGAHIATTDPGLDDTYAPGLVSAARDGGDWALCTADPMVAGIDLYGNTRIASDHDCALGAIERDLLDSSASALTFGHVTKFTSWLAWLLLIVLFVAFALGLAWQYRRRNDP